MKVDNQVENLGGLAQVLHLGGKLSLVRATEVECTMYSRVKNLKVLEGK